MVKTVVWLQTIGSANAKSPKSDEKEKALACIANISPSERRKRLLGGAIPFAVSLIILAALIALGADRLWRLPLFLLFGMAASGFFQWRDKT